MISKTATTSLQLPPHTIRTCRDLYENLTRSTHRQQAMTMALSEFESDPQALNKFWWVLNYHAESLDSNRKLRAWVESRLEELAMKKIQHHALQA